MIEEYGKVVVENVKGVSYIVLDGRYACTFCEDEESNLCVQKGKIQETTGSRSGATTSEHCGLGVG